MINRDSEKVCLFIDGANLYATARQLDIQINYAKLFDYFSSKHRIIRAYYYTSIRTDIEPDGLHKFVTWLSYNRYSVVTKPAKAFTNDTGGIRLKGNMDINIAVDAMELAPHIDHIILFSGDGDFCRLLECLQSKGIRVSIVSSMHAIPNVLSDALRRQADSYVDLRDIAAEICDQSRSLNKNIDAPTNAGISRCGNRQYEQA